MTAGAWRIPAADLRAVARDVLAACGMAPDDAATVAEVLVEADLRGVRTHGVALLPWYAEGLRSGRIDPGGSPRVVREQGATAVIDGGGGMGHLAALAAIRLACQLAGEHGVGVVGVRGSNHCGAIGTYARRALESGMVGVVLATSVPTMAPPGGRTRALGNNPVAIAVPTDEEPVVLDAAFSAVSRQRIVAHAHSGTALEPGWALDPAGRPTVDAEAALQGLLEPIGGYKGAGFALVTGLLAALGGAGFGAELGSLSGGSLPGRDGLLAIALDPGAFGDAASVRARLGASVRGLRTSEPVQPGIPIRLPGDQASATEHRSVTDGVPIDDPTRRALARLCDDLAVGSANLTG